MASFRRFAHTLGGKTFHSCMPLFSTPTKKLFHRHILDLRPKIPRASIFFHYGIQGVKQMHRFRQAASPCRHVRRRVPAQKKATARRCGGKQPCLSGSGKPQDTVFFQCIGSRRACAVRFRPPCEKKTLRATPTPSKAPRLPAAPCATARQVRADAGDTDRR